MVTNKKLESIERKTDAVTVILARLDKVAAGSCARSLGARSLAFQAGSPNTESKSGCRNEDAFPPLSRGARGSRGTPGRRRL